MMVLLPVYGAFQNIHTASFAFSVILYTTAVYDLVKYVKF